MTALAFVHERLSEAKNEIRLLRMLPQSQDDDEDDHLRFSISVRTLFDDPEYNTISYTWGDVAVRRTILIDGKTFSVHSNCYDALKQVYRQWISGLTHNPYVWVDSVCIDQAHLPEKGYQVALMGDIYARAAFVFSCLGLHADDSKFLLETAASLDKIYVPCKCSSSPGNDYPCEHIEPQCRVWISSFTTGEFGRLADAHYAFTRRAYWQRIWIIQEVAKAKVRVMLCDADIVSWRALQILQSVFATCTLHSNQSLIRDMPERFRTPANVQANLVQNPMERLTQATKYKLGITSVFEMYNTFKCFDPRDHLYGLLAVIEWPAGTKPLLPDYKVSPLDLALRTVDYATWIDAIPNVIRTLGLTANHDDVKKLIDHRRSGCEPIEHQDTEAKDQSHNRPVIYPIGFFGAPRCACIVRDHLGNLSLSQTRTTERTKRPHDTITTDSDRGTPKKLFKDGSVVGSLCSAANDGDLLFLVSDEPRHIYFVLRQAQGNKFDIVGQGIDVDGHSLLDPLSDGTQVTFQAEFHITISVEDCIALFIQDMVAMDSGPSGIDETARQARLFTRVTNSPYGAAILEDSDPPILERQ